MIHILLAAFQQGSFQNIDHIYLRDASFPAYSFMFRGMSLFKNQGKLTLSFTSRFVLMCFFNIVSHVCH